MKDIFKEVEDYLNTYLSAWMDISWIVTQMLKKIRGPNAGNHQKDYKGKYKGLKAKIAILTKRIDDMTKRKSEKGKKDREKSEKGLLAESFDWDDDSVSWLLTRRTCCTGHTDTWLVLIWEKLVALSTGSLHT
nr:hypothetical protein [Tanacetum cinerariifolium]